MSHPVSKPGETDDERLSSSADSHPEDQTASLWRVMLIVAAAGLLASFSFNMYLIKQNHLLMNQRSQLKEQIQQTQLLVGTLRSLVEDLARFSLQYPDARDILLKIGLKVNVVGSIPPVPPATAPASAAPATNKSPAAVGATPSAPSVPPVPRAGGSSKKRR